jgi:V/A-type H+-transporting ATPase subunit A
MMKVVGEEGTSVDDYVIYQKGELLDSVYLQQNSFDPVDSAVLPERQEETFDVLFHILGSIYDLEDKKEVRLFFNEVRQKFLDWNNVEQKSERFGQLEEELTELYRSKAVGFDPVAEKLLSGGAR